MPENFLSLLFVDAKLQSLVTSLASILYVCCSHLNPFTPWEMQTNDYNRNEMRSHRSSQQMQNFARLHMFNNEIYFDGNLIKFDEGMQFHLIHPTCQ